MCLLLQQEEEMVPRWKMFLGRVGERKGYVTQEINNKLFVQEISVIKDKIDKTTKTEKTKSKKKGKTLHSVRTKQDANLQLQSSLFKIQLSAVTQKDASCLYPPRKSNTV